ncbi:tetratricopeptide TPR_3 [Candidatus Scalindua japonica]|uniref:Tetratricopeptide TPR_3 n=1 Tax=Candidatus Scalindua japonica TaxID=1284222 RepID=A0A286U451_9BACT|nr:tetratricopeptide TPR_3 [Candidatus Scalindua japonica]
MSVFVVKNFAGNLYYHKWEGLPQRDEDSIAILEDKTAKFIPSKSDTFYQLGKYYHNKAFTADSLEEQLEIFKKAEQFLTRAILLQPGNSYYLAEYARVVGNQGDAGMAINYFERSTTLSRTDALIHKIYARWSLYRAQSVFRIEDLDFLVKMYNNPEQTIPFYEERLIDGIMTKTFINIAEREWGEVLRLGIPKSRRTYRNLGDLYMMTCKLNKAIENYRHSESSIRLINSYFIKQDFTTLFSVVKHIIGAKNRVFLSRWDEIRKLLERITIFDRNSYEAFYWLGQGHYQQNMFNEAINVLEKVTTLKPDHVNGHLFLAKSYEAVKKSEKAIHEYTEVLKLKPGHKEASELLSRAIKSKL